MPGLVGIASNREIDRQLLARMADSIKYEEWYKVDSYTEPLFGASRVDLGIFNPEPQPIFNEDKTLCIFMYGKVYDYERESNQLKHKGHEFTVGNDAEFCLHLYEEYGQDFANKLNGSFVLVLCNLKQKKVIICNDRYGLRPLYYTTNGGKLLFASEVKAILQDESFEKVLNDETIAEFLVYGGEITGNKTFFQGIEVLPPASIFTYQDGKCQIRQYWDFDYQPDYNITAEEYAEQLADVFRKAVNIRLAEKLRYGLWLSGGMDSRLIASAIDKDSIPRIVAYTFGSSGCDEYRVARKVAQTLDMKHVFLEYQPDEAITYGKKAVYVTDGFDWVGMGANFHAFTRIAESAEVSFNGLPGDLSLGGSFINRSILAAQNDEALLALLKKGRTLSENMMAKIFTSPYHAKVKGMPLELKRKALEDSKPEHPGNKADYFYMQNHVRRFSLKGDVLARVNQEVASPFYDNDFVDVILKTPPEYRLNHRLYVKVLRKLSPELARITYANRRIRADAPLIWWKLAYFAWGGEIVANRALNKWVGRQLWLFNRYHNIDCSEWMSTDAGWKKFTEGLLLSKETRSGEFLSKDYVKALVQQHQQGKAEHATRLGLLMTFELFLRMFK